jgi:plastocyanin domain-containing protein
MKRFAISLIGLVLAGAATAFLLDACQPSGSSQSGREVRVDVTDKGFEPAEVKVPANQAITLVMTRKTDQTCAKEVVFESLNQRYTLPLNQSVRIDLPASPGGTLSYQCGMKMLGGRIVIQ